MRDSIDVLLDAPQVAEQVGATIGKLGLEPDTARIIITLAAFAYQTGRLDATQRLSASVEQMMPANSDGPDAA